MKHVLCVLGALVVVSGDALAQNDQLSVQNEVIGSITVDDMIAILQSAQLTATLKEEDQEGTKTIEAAAQGVTVYVALRGCQGMGAAAPCDLVQPFGFFQAQGVTFDQVNNFNMNVSGIATAALLDQNRGVMATKIYLNGGVTQANLYYTLAVFFSDINRLLEAVKPGVIAQIDYAPGGYAASAGIEFTDFARGGGPWRVNAVGSGAPGLMTEPVRAALERRGKIEN